MRHPVEILERDTVRNAKFNAFREIQVILGVPSLESAQEVEVESVQICLDLLVWILLQLLEEIIKLDNQLGILVAVLIQVEVESLYA